MKLHSAANAEQPHRSKWRLINPTLFSGSIAELLHPPANQIPFLDGLRSVAILLVISGHLSHKFAEANGSNFYSRLPFVANGWIGVDLFFVLSGFFIGSQLWKELLNQGSISVGRFLLRRGFRIWPLYFFTFFCVLTLNLILARQNASAKQYGWSDLLFITNFHNRGLVMGSWSLCTEEQFYIVTPLALFFLARYVRSIRNYRTWLWVLLMSIPLLRAAVWMHVTGHFFLHDPALFEPLFYSSLTHCDGLIMGLIIANLWVTRERPAARVATPGVLVILAVGLMLGLHQLQREIIDFSVLALFFGSIAWLGLQRRIAIFNSRLFYWISRLSYGMYLNHEYMCPWLADTILPRLPLSARLPVITNLIGVVLITMLSAAIALLTFCWIEYPFLQLRKTLLGPHLDRVSLSNQPVLPLVASQSNDTVPASQA